MAKIRSSRLQMQISNLIFMSFFINLNKKKLFGTKSIFDKQGKRLFILEFEIKIMQ